MHEVSNGLAADVYVNVQGDEPLVRPEQIATLLDVMKDESVQVGTVKTPCPPEDVRNPNAVKVVTAADGRALYFSRATIPFDRDGGQPRYFKHLGLYAYRKPALDLFVSQPESALEKSERLEQLRFLENGISIYVGETPYDSVGVDTEEDLQRVAEILLGVNFFFSTDNKEFCRLRLRAYTLRASPRFRSRHAPSRLRDASGTAILSTSKACAPPGSAWPACSSTR